MKVASVHLKLRMLLVKTVSTSFYLAAFFLMTTMKCFSIVSKIAFTFGSLKKPFASILTSRPPDCSNQSKSASEMLGSDLDKSMNNKSPQRSFWSMDLMERYCYTCCARVDRWSS